MVSIDFSAPPVSSSRRQSILLSYLFRKISSVAVRRPGGFVVGREGLTWVPIYFLLSALKITREHRNWISLRRLWQSWQLNGRETVAKSGVGGGGWALLPVGGSGGGFGGAKPSS